MLAIMGKKSISTSDPYDSALEWFKNRNGVDFLDLVDDETKRQAFYKKATSENDKDEKAVQSCYRHTISNHYK